MSKRAINTIKVQQCRQMQRYPDPAKQFRGKKSRNMGNQFENLITKSCECYKSLDMAEIDKTPEPMKIKRLENNRFIACFLKRAQPDFKGTIQGGRSIVFEAKYTDSGQMEQSRVTDVQERALDRHQLMGAKCFVIISFGMTDFFRIPWDDWKNMKKLFERKYIRAGELEDYRISIGRNGVLLFLE